MTSMSEMNEAMKRLYLPVVKEMLETEMNAFNLFTWRGESVWCPNCDPDHRMNIDPSRNNLICTRCSLTIPFEAVEDSGEKVLTIEVLDRILQNLAHRKEAHSKR